MMARFRRASKWRPPLITTHAADAVENCLTRDYGRRTVGSRAMRKPLYEARRHATSDNDAPRARARRRSGDCETSTGPTRWGRSVSEAIGSRLVAGFDAIAIFGAGVAAIHWDRSAIDWRLKALSSCWAQLLGVNFLHLAGAHRFDQFGDLGAAIGRALLGWLLTLGSFSSPRFLIEPLMATNGTWVALWFSAASCCW